MSPLREKQLPAPPRPDLPNEQHRPFTPSTPPKSPEAAQRSPQQVQDTLSTRIERLRAENHRLQAHVDELQANMSTLHRKHMVEITTRTTLLRRQNMQYHQQLHRQNELITEIVRKVHSIFSDYKDEVDSMRQSFEDVPEGDPVDADEIKVYRSAENGSWI